LVERSLAFGYGLGDLMPEGKWFQINVQTMDWDQGNITNMVFRVDEDTADRVATELSARRFDCEHKDISMEDMLSPALRIHAKMRDVDPNGKGAGNNV
jgi:hypothetical protein